MDDESRLDAPVKRRDLPELPFYYTLVALYFFAFGMQFVLFPSLVAFTLEATAAGVGLAQSALSAPMFCLLLFGGLLAERAKAGPTLAMLQVCFAAASIVLGATIAAGALTYAFLVGYAIVVGACAAFMMPVRDAALNGVVIRETGRGRHTPIATAAATTTAVQIGAQIAGILVAGLVGASLPALLGVQAVVLSAGAAVALFLQAPKPTGHEHTIMGAARDIGDGLA
jgi:MFS family permease